MLAIISTNTASGTITSQLSKSTLWFPFLEDKTEDQNGSVTCSRAHRPYMAGPTTDASFVGLSSSKAHSLSMENFQNSISKNQIFLFKGNTL